MEVIVTFFAIIFQTLFIISLDQHIGKVTYRCAATETCSHIFACFVHLAVLAILEKWVNLDALGELGMVDEDKATLNSLHIVGMLVEDGATRSRWVLGLVRVDDDQFDRTE